MRAAGMIGVLALAIATPADAGAAFPTKARTDGGTVQGETEGEVAVWRGVPYAAAPVGDLRWRAPQPVAAWRGVRSATVMSPDCVQGRMPGPSIAPPAPLSEDCLYLNVWRPAQGAKRERLPVVVWIHGGAFVNGGSSSPDTWGDALAARGVVVVTFNYRLGRLGFFGHPALSAEHPEELKGNYGLMDQVAALQWVRRNISAFGGDPDNVTLMGESAGGISVNLLLGAPQAKGLFRRVVVQSGAGRDFLGREKRLSQDLPDSPSAESVGVQFAARQGVEGRDAAALAALRALPPEKITGDLSMMTLVVAGPGALHAGPVVDGELVPRTPEAMFRASAQQRVPMMVGATTADLSLEFSTSAAATYAKFGDAADRARAVYDPDGTLSLTLLNRAVGADRSMVEPARFAARVVADAGQPVYAYRFGYVAEARRAQSPWGADHASDVAYVFDRLPAAIGDQVAPADAAVANRWAGYLANFARTGDPNGAGLPAWPLYDAGGDVLMLVGPDGAFEARPDPWRARLDLLEERANAR